MKLRGNMLTIFNLFVQHKRLTDFELENLCEINCNSIRGARLKLEQKRLIRRTEEKKKHFENNKRGGAYTIYELIVKPTRQSKPQTNPQTNPANLANEVLKELIAKLQTLTTN